MPSYKEVVKNLEERVIMPDRPPSLLPVKEGLNSLNLGYDPKKVIVVAGTNGKGTVSATLSVLLEATGAKVGLYTSPHLIDTTERIRINSKPISQEKFVTAFDFVKKKIPHERLSHFEMLTLMAHTVFTSEKCDWIIYEVGLGGIWDATNAFDHDTSVICRLGFDHQDILGQSMWEIAKNKLGITRDGREHKVIHLPLPIEVDKLFINYKKQMQSQFIEVNPFRFEIDKTKDEPVYRLQTPWGVTPLRLMGQRAVENSSLALRVFSELGFDPREFLSALKKVNWPGRMDFEVYENKKIYFSGDHNPQGVESLKEILSHFGYRNLWAVIGIGKAKDAKQMLETFSSIPRTKILLTETPFRGMNLSDYKFDAIYSNSDPKTVLDYAVAKSEKEDMILVTGSLYLVGELKRLIK
ncbi:MAG: hypothetical protein A4S09_08020 [Proteobacteria bacterium SG_bin7]|nr:MAG: hypothetical protein A4S09_08020 [Proteobacteria bacterium SG_bin7]